jgi:hypothetical protein
MPKVTIYTCEPCGYSCGNRKSSYDKHLASNAHQCKVECNVVKSEPVSRIQELEQLLQEKDAKIETLTMQLKMKDEMISILKQFGGGGCQIVTVPNPLLAAAQPPPPPPTPAIVVEERKKSFNKEHFLNVICKDAKNIEDFNFEELISEQDVYQIYNKYKTSSSWKGQPVALMTLFKKVIESVPKLQRPVWCFDSKRFKYMERIEGQWVDPGNYESGKPKGFQFWGKFIYFLLKMLENKPLDLFGMFGIAWNPGCQFNNGIANQLESLLHNYLKVDKTNEDYLI